MRKIIAVLLATLMLASVLAMLPASAATYDGTTAASVGKPELIITEIAQRTHEKDGLKDNASSAAEKPTYGGCAGYVEVFNNTAAQITLSNYSLLRAVYMEGDPGDGQYYHEQWMTWSNNRKFLNKMDLKVGAILDATKKTEMYPSIFPEGDQGSDIVYASLQNSADDLALDSGKAAVIWFITEETVNWLKAELSKSITTYNTLGPRGIFVKRFYGTEANADDYNIVMVWAHANWDDEGNPATDMFTWEIPANREVYPKSIIMAIAENSWNLNTDNCQTPNAKIKSMVTIGHAVDNYIAISDPASTATSGIPSFDNHASVFAPATTKPFYLNQKNKGISNPTYDDYVAAKLANSYLEVGAVLWATAQTPGQITDWQYAMMAAALNVALPDSVNTPEKQTAVLNAFYDAEMIGDPEEGNDEVKQDHNYVDRDELEAMFSGALKDEEKESNGLIFVIIGAAVLVVGAAAVVIFVIILPKKKAAAAAAAAAAEDTPVEDAPAEDAPVEDAPAAEEKTEE